MRRVESNHLRWGYEPRVVPDGPARGDGGHDHDDGALTPGGCTAILPQPPYPVNYFLRYNLVQEGHMDTSRLSYLLYRCIACRRLLTKLDIIAEWERVERAQEQSRGICPCGGSRVSPTNATLWEELTIPRVWKLWWSEVVLPWWRAR